jgi:hypothetical protein
MTIRQLLQWQWQGYPKYHQSRRNLLIHIVAVPLFLVGTVAFVGAVAQLSLAFLIVAMVFTLLALVLEGRGHGLEPVSPEPFTSPLNFVSRFFLEQWVTFPRFVLTGRWLAALHRASAP